MSDTDHNGDHAITVAEPVSDVPTQAARLSTFDLDSPVSLSSAPLMQLVFEDLECIVKVKPKPSRRSCNPCAKAPLEEKSIICGVTGVIKAARTTAVMGASGAGKTTLLNMLAGFRQPNAMLEGTISVNGQPVNGQQMRTVSGFVHQEDVILATMTVREALTFAAVLKLPKSIARARKVEQALKVADMLNLTGVLDNVVGSSLTKGISGGEKRRLSLGMEMITNPSILFLDEPTSGLDTYTAFKVMRILHGVSSQQGRTVVATIHQPSSDIFHLFDDLIVLAEGRTLYMGEAGQMVAYFDALGYHCPRFTNPADFLFMDVLYTGKRDSGSVYHLGLVGACEGQGKEEGSNRDKARAQNDAARLQQLLDAWPRSSPATELQAFLASDKLQLGQGITSAAVMQTAGFGTQFALLFHRAGANALRNKLMVRTKLVQTLFLGLVAGLIYLGLDNDYKSVQDRQGALFFLTVQGLITGVISSLSVFGTEKTVFIREYGSRMYGLPSYFFSRLLIELPTRTVLPFILASISYWLIGFQPVATKFLWLSLILILMDNCGAALGMLTSCLFSSIEVALSIAPMLIMPLMVFAGFFVNLDNIGPWFIWISYLSPIRYGFNALALNEFEGLELECAPTDPCPPGFSGESVIEALSLELTVEQNAGILFGYVCACLCLAYLALWIQIRATSN